MPNLPILGSEDSVILRPSKIIALGLNYRDHIAESVSVKVRGFDQTEPTEPVLFPKLPSSLIGPEETILLPRIAQESGFENPRTDYEAELAVIIGRSGKHIAREDVWDYIYGFTAANDVSQRNIQNGDRSGWFRGKSFDTFCPVGPVVVPREKLPDPGNLAIACRLNGRLVQESNTGHMIFDIPTMVAYISRNFTLEAGDLILTGTPSGVGRLSPGDVVEIEIEGIGVLRNPVEAE